MIRLALTPGEPAGIGPDLILQLIRRQSCPENTECVVIADTELLAERAATLGLDLDLGSALPSFSPAAPTPGFSVLSTAGGMAKKPGEPSTTTAGYVLKCLERAVAGCSDGQFHGLVTGPVQKEIINVAGIPFTGHTEFLASLTNTEHVVMLLVADQLRVALLTTHLPLRDVPDAINAADLSLKLQILDSELSRLFITGRPRIGVAGLNPHAGEGGYLGTEEIDIIAPVIRQLSADGMQVSGPWPADTIFTQERLPDFDVVLAMYHDQGLPVLKHAGFGIAVNVTLGLPLIRTSVDHGTALDLAGTGRADAGSLQQALNLSANLAKNRFGSCG